MTAPTITTRTVALLLFGCAALCVPSHAQTETEIWPLQSTLHPAAPPANDKPLPDIVAMMHDVEANQRKSESVEKDYIYRSILTEQEGDGNGKIKKTRGTESDLV